ncbi:S8 family serine peptidase [Alteromonas sp. a30]|uniref:S8 family serine peptidase n=1 Tax=Alteromonas sp. a30 TaxID=2730917 RepID=UPI002DDD5D27|nr:S8 family serine peptidase [Alteromonas sp. a30]MCY7294007.1 S8 family serine peptidase [Alteromonas sp. a30]
MKTNLTLSAISMALVGASCMVQAASLTPVENSGINQNDSKVNKSAFSTWYQAEQSKKFAAKTDQIIVRFKQQSTLEQLKSEASQSSKSISASSKASGQSLLSSLSASAGMPMSFVKATSAGEAVLKFKGAMSHQAIEFIARGMKSNALIESVEADARRYPMAQNSPWGLSRVQAEQLSDSASGNITVCIIDSGYERANPDLPSGSNVNGTNDSGTGNWYQAGGSHGTHVAGTIAALNNSIGVEGILPTGNVNLHIIKVFNEDGYAYSSGLVEAVEACQDGGADVVNMSLGGPSATASERNGMQALAEDGMLLIAAAGNDGDSTHSYPASYDSVVSVAAVDENNQHANFSQYTNQVELSAPGEAILSTVAGDGRQGYLSVGSTSFGDDRIVPHTRFTPNGSNFEVDNYDGSVTGQLAACSRSGSSYSCGNMSGKICIAERNANQAGSDYPEINAAKACVDAGASGVIIYSNSARPGLQNPFLVDRDVDLDGIPTASVNRTLGQELLSSVGSSATLSILGNRDYDYYNGTSMATPHVVGVAALAWSNNRSCTASEVRQALRSTAIDLDVAGRDNRTGYGLVQAKAASDYMADNCGSSNGGGDSGGGDDSSLTKGQAVSGLAGAKSSQTYFTFSVPAGATNLTFNLSGGSGDADLYVSFGGQPTTGDFDCRSWASGNTESCSFSSPQAGTYHVLINAYSAYSGAALVADYSAASSGGATGNTATLNNLSGSRGEFLNYTYTVPAGMSSLEVTTSGGSGDADLYIRLGQAPTTSNYDCRSNGGSNSEVCTFNNPTPGTYHIGIRGYSSFSGLNLTASYQP